MIRKIDYKAAWQRALLRTKEARQAYLTAQADLREQVNYSAQRSAEILGYKRELRETRESWNADRIKLDREAITLRSDNQALSKQVDRLLAEAGEARGREDSLREIYRVVRGQNDELRLELFRALDASKEDLNALNLCLSLLPKKELDKPATGPYIVRRGFTKPYKEAVRQ